MTAKEKVRRLRRDAHAWMSWFTGDWVVSESTKNGAPELGQGGSEDAAWEAALAALAPTTEAAKDGELDPLIREAEAAKNDHVVLYMSERGLHWRDYPESACQCVKDVLAPEIECRVMTKEEFLSVLRRLRDEEGGEDGGRQG